MGIGIMSALLRIRNERQNKQESKPPGKTEITKDQKIAKLNELLKIERERTFDLTIKSENHETQLKNLEKDHKNLKRF
eukprot:UN10446